MEQIERVAEHQEESYGENEVEEILGDFDRPAMKEEESPFEVFPADRWYGSIERNNFFSDLHRKLNYLQECLPYLKAMEKNPQYDKMGKGLSSKKVESIIQQYVPAKEEDPGSISIDINFANGYTDQGPIDMGSGYNIMPSSIYNKIGTPKLKSSNAYLKMADGTWKMAIGELGDYLVRLGELIVPVDFVVVDINQDDEEEPYLELGRPFMETTKMEINMRDRILKMTVMGKTLKVDIMDEEAPIHYKARPFPYDFDETELDQAVEGMKGMKKQALQRGVQKGERVRENARKPWRIDISGYLRKDPKEKNGNKETLAINSIQIFNSNIGTESGSKRKGEETLALSDEKKKKIFRESGDEDLKINPNPNGEQDKDVGPKGDGMDQHGAMINQYFT